jgi:hypothetical protein
MLLERERKVGAAVQILVEEGERAEAEPAQRVVEQRRAHRNSSLTPSKPRLLRTGRKLGTVQVTDCYLRFPPIVKAAFPNK